MKAQVAVYESHQAAIDAVKELQRGYFPIEKVSIVGQAQIIDDQMQLKSNAAIENAPLAIGAIAGPVVGLLTGIGLFAIPGFGFLYGAGALIGVMGGFELGTLGGGIVSLLTILGIDKQQALHYKERMESGHFLLVVQGSMEDIQQAEHILHTEKTQMKFGA